MTLPDPRPGLVFRYEYLWHDQATAGRDVAAKDRPACIILAVKNSENETKVLIVPITRSPPSADVQAVELPAKVKRHLGLDGTRSWIVLSEANIDIWPTPDMRQIPGKPGQFVYGFLPLTLLNDIRGYILSQIDEKRLRSVARD